MDMHEVIIEKHSHKAPPKTCQKNTKLEPIDGIFATRAINSLAAGYLTYR